MGRLASRSALMRARRAVERARGMVDEGKRRCYEKDSWTEEW